MFSLLRYSIFRVHQFDILSGRQKHVVSEYESGEQRMLNKEIHMPENYNNRDKWEPFGQAW
jgi:hypothetical protein